MNRKVEIARWEHSQRQHGRQSPLHSSSLEPMKDSDQVKTELLLIASFLCIPINYCLVLSTGS